VNAAPAPFADVERVAYEISRTEEGTTVLRRRFERSGYLYFPKTLDGALTASVLAGVLDVLKPHVVWDDAAAAPLLRGEPFFESDPLWDALYPEVQSLEALHALFHSEPVQAPMRRVAGDAVFVYPMKMARVASPRKLGYETPPHQDAYSHHAGPSMAGIWIALHDVGESMGRLAILPGSHRGGVRAVHNAAGVGGVQCDIRSDETLWHVSDVSAGDVIIFHSCTVHRAEANTDSCRVRLSVDTRFCDYGAPVFATNLEPHHGWRIPKLDWEYVYRNWRERNLCYYWRDYPARFGA